MTGQQRPPRRLQFFAPLEVALTPDERERVLFAYTASKYGHAAQVRDDGSRYFDHPKGAAWIYISELGGLDDRVIIDILLHDLCGDTHILSLYRVRVNFGKDIALDVQALSKLKGVQEPTADYLARIVGRGSHAIIAKLLDRLHNVRTGQLRPSEKREELIRETREYHLPTFIPALRQYGGKWTEYAGRIEAMFSEALAALEQQ